MKKKTIIISIFVSIVILLIAYLFLINKQEENTIIYFKYEYGYVPLGETEHQGELLKGQSLTYSKIELKDNKYVLESNISDDIYYVYDKLDKKDMAELQKIIQKNNVYEWKTFNEENFDEYRSNNAGKYFILEITYKNGKNIKVATNLEFPSNYEYVHTDIMEHLESIMRRAFE
jgi:hypothetical protein